VFPNGGLEARYAFPGTAPTNQFVSRFFTTWFDGARPIEGVRLSADNALLRADVRAALESKLKTAASAPIDFGHTVELLDYNLPMPAPKPGQAVVLVTWWRVKPQARLSPNLTMFVHLLRGEQIVAQQDLLSVMPETLRPGDVFAQVHEFINVPPDAAPGNDVLAIGLYDSITGQRLTIYLNSQPQGDRLTLIPIPIIP
jgi:hypothetical protein